VSVVRVRVVFGARVRLSRLAVGKLNFPAFKRNVFVDELTVSDLGLSTKHPVSIALACR